MVTATTVPSGAGIESQEAAIREDDLKLEIRVGGDSGEDAGHFKEQDVVYFNCSAQCVFPVTEILDGYFFAQNGGMRVFEGGSRVAGEPLKVKHVEELGFYCEKARRFLEFLFCLSFVIQDDDLV